MESGRPLKSSMNTDRLKDYTVDNREELSKRLPGIRISRVKKAEDQPTEPIPEGFEPSEKILRERTT